MFYKKFVDHHKIYIRKGKDKTIPVQAVEALRVARG
jgi:hypothetical protein